MNHLICTISNIVTADISVVAIVLSLIVTVICTAITIVKIGSAFEYLVIMLS